MRLAITAYTEQLDREQLGHSLAEGSWSCSHVAVNQMCVELLTTGETLAGVELANLVWQQPNKGVWGTLKSMGRSPLELASPQEYVEEACEAEFCSIA